jgi:hypothetical protein
MFFWQALLVLTEPVEHVYSSPYLDEATSGSSSRSLITVPLRSPRFGMFPDGGIGAHWFAGIILLVENRKCTWNCMRPTDSVGEVPDSVGFSVLRTPFLPRLRLNKSIKKYFRIKPRWMTETYQARNYQ